MVKRNTDIDRNASRDANDRAAIQERLRFVLKERSQADIARATGTSRNNISRYMRGAKIPIEFGTALVRGLNVNPAWLLAGEGTPYLSQVAGKTADLADEFTDLVNAMNAVLKMKIGSLAGDILLKSIRQLNEALNEYTLVHERVVQKLSPIVLEIKSRSKDAIDSGDIGNAELYLSALEKCCWICQDRCYWNTYYGQKGAFLFMQNKEEEALEAQVKGLGHVAYNPLKPSNSYLNSIHTLSAILISSGRHAESGKLLRVGKALTFDAQETDLREWYSIFSFALGLGDVMLGDNIHAGISAMLEHSPCLPPGRKRQGDLYIHYALKLSGTMSLQESFDKIRYDVSEAQEASRDFIGKSCFAAWTETLADAKAVYRKLRSLPETIRQYVHASAALYSRLLVGALESPESKVLHDYLQDDYVKAVPTSSSHMDRFDVAVCTCQLARLVGEEAKAVKALGEGDDVLTSAPPEITLDLLLRANHYRNALLLVPGKTRSAKRRELRERAQHFFDEHYAKGYGCFEKYASKA